MPLTLSSTDRVLLRDVVDALPSPAAVCSASGQLLYQSPSLARLLGAEPMALRMRAAISSAARALVAAKDTDAASAASCRDPWTCEVHAGTRRYELRGGLLAIGPQGSRSVAALFLVRAASPRALSDAELHDRFRLTTREVEVLRLLAIGRSAREVAAMLGLSYFTARHHVEHVLAKLGVRTRAAVAAITGS